MNLNLEWKYDSGTVGAKHNVLPLHAIGLLETLIIQDGVESIAITRTPPEEERVSHATPEEEALIKKCLEIMVTEKKISVSLIQRRFRLGYLRGCAIANILIERGYVKPRTTGQLNAAPFEILKTE